MFSSEYTVKENGTSRPVGYGDIAVICRKTEQCRLIMEACEDAGIPAYLQGDVKIMSTREGKLALAWLRYVNNDRDPWAFVPIMSDMDYTPIEIRNACDKPELYIPANIKSQREDLYKKRRRITDLLTTLFSFYNLDNDITQAIITTLSSIHRGSLLTVSDVIRIIEDDIKNGSTYPVENFIDSKAVTIMTMHKSKGLEFPVVITPFIDRGSVPLPDRDTDTFTFSETFGIRCSKEIGHFADYSKICEDWKTKLVKSTHVPDYSEERRLMFVALSRAKQYETIIYGPKPSKFIESIITSEPVAIPEVASDPGRFSDSLMEIPKIPDYPARRAKLSVHDLLHFEDENGKYSSENTDEVGGKGMEYGTKIHKMAEVLCNGGLVDDSYPEMAEVRKVLERTGDADFRYAEIECGLPLNDMNATIRGVIDLLALYPDHVEVHDYKTDVSDRFEREYEVQLSVYAYAVEGFYHKPVECYIDYVSRGQVKKVEIVPISEIKDRAKTAINVIINNTGNQGV